MSELINLSFQNFSDSKVSESNKGCSYRNCVLRNIFHEFFDACYVELIFTIFDDKILDFFDVCRSNFEFFSENGVP